MSMLSRVAGCLLASLLLAVAGGAQAQSRVEEQQQRRVEQPGNNAPVWREVRSGNEGYTSMQGREVGVLVQSAGETWRQIR
ncbi:MAG: formate dehydrogenase subunit gamma, partial [Burkholderiales bacterium]